jgi:hypothetical protein
MVGSLARDALCAWYSSLQRLGVMLRSILFGSSGAFVRTTPGIYCGARIQFHLARGQLRL